MSIFTKLLGVVTDTIGITNSASDAVKTIKEAIAGNPELQSKIEELEFAERKGIQDLIKAEMQSADPFVRRVRPAIIWICGGVIAINFGLLPITNSIIAAFGGTPLILIYPELPEPIYWLIGGMFTGYAGARSYDKKKK